MKGFIELDNCNLSGVSHMYVHEDYSFCVAVCAAGEEICAKRLQNWLALRKEEYLLSVQEKAEGVDVVCISKSYKIKAVEFLDYLFEAYGLIKGDSKCAKGSLPDVLLRIRMEDLDLQEIDAYLMQRVAHYFEECENVESETFAAANEKLIASLPVFRKKQVDWACVKTLDIAPAGTRLFIKSLENETGIPVTAGEDSYIMIGCLGEVYEICKVKFENTYDDTGEKLDLFSTFFDFLPAVEKPETGEYIPIDELAKICRPKPGNGILALELNNRTKIFRPDWEDYFIGNQGDYMAIRKDDHKDIYIIQKEVFCRTYEPAE